MAVEEKKYYYIKLEDNYFDIKVQKALRKLPSGSEMLICYLKMQLKYANRGGIIKFDGIYENIFEEIAIDIDETKDIVRITIQCLARWNVLELNDNDIYMSEMQHRIGTKTDVALRVANYRERKKQKELLQCNNDVTKCNAISEIEIEDRKIDINNIYTQLEKIDLVQNLTDQYNSIFISKGIYITENIQIPDKLYLQIKLYQATLKELIDSEQNENLGRIDILILEKVYGQVMAAEKVDHVVNYFKAALLNEFIKKE